MLTAVLLQVIESTRPVHDACDLFSGTDKPGLGNNVIDNSTFVLEHVHYRSAVERSQVIWLTAAGRVKRRLVKHDAIASIGSRHTENCGLKFEQVRVAEIKSCC